MNRAIQIGLMSGLILTCACLTASVHACNVPVFRYALEKWDAGPHEAIVFYEGQLDAEAKAALKKLQVAADAEPAQCNLRVHLVDLARADDDVRKLYTDQKRNETPLVVLRYPALGKVDAVYWSGLLTDANVQRILHSPARKEVASRLLKGAASVWVFLESGNKEKDDAKLKLMTDELARLQAKLHRPPILPLTVASTMGWLGDPYRQRFFPAGRLLDESTILDFQELQLNPDSVVAPIKIEFSVLRVNRKAAEEEVFIRMFQRSEPDLLNPEYRSEPMAFAVFGRGRSLWALIGEGINPDTLGDDAAYLTGPCTCQVKQQNPGFDLLFSAGWDSNLTDRFVKDKELPPLIGLGGFIPTKPKNNEPVDPEKQPEPKAPPKTDPQSSDPEVQPPADNPAPPKKSVEPVNQTAQVASDPRSQETKPSQIVADSAENSSNVDVALLRNGLIALAASVAVVACLFLVVWPKIPKRAG